MVLSSYVTVDGWLTALRISQKPIASFFRQLTKTKTNPKKVLGFWFGSTVSNGLTIDMITSMDMVEDIPSLEKFIVSFILVGY